MNKATSVVGNGKSTAKKAVDIVAANKAKAKAASVQALISTKNKKLKRLNNIENKSSVNAASGKILKNSINYKKSLGKSKAKLRLSSCSSSAKLRSQSAANANDADDDDSSSENDENTNEDEEYASASQNESGDNSQGEIDADRDADAAIDDMDEDDDDDEEEEGEVKSIGNTLIWILSTFMCLLIGLDNSALNFDFCKNINFFLLSFWSFLLNESSKSKRISIFLNTVKYVNRSNTARTF